MPSIISSLVGTGSPTNELSFIYNLSDELFSSLIRMPFYWRYK